MRGLLSSCGVWVFSLVEVRELSSCGSQAQLPRGMWDLSSPTRHPTRVPCMGRRTLNHWTTREVPPSQFNSLQKAGTEDGEHFCEKDTYSLYLTWAWGGLGRGRVGRWRAAPGEGRVLRAGVVSLPNDCLPRSAPEPLGSQPDLWRSHALCSWEVA